MDINTRFEAKQQELRNVQQRETFLRAQLEEAVQARLQLIGQLTLLQEMAQEQAGEQAAPTPAAQPHIPRGRRRNRNREA
jgi:hypothetical protein